MADLKLSDADIAARLAALPEWKIDGKVISRRFSFSSFPEAIQFTNSVAEIAEERKHHPFIQIDFKHVTLKLTTWHAGGLTEEDFEEARAFDALYQS
ncbi:4a-hydroxytetrahydrobiopterin dehydratase [Alicyclobacillus ferrooxydans]|uniref:4a-hydroxytetrahydrobiopterin dehydratase n=1 Tax=Alicyclobacillus ferrooxydans TaxID=471514 RepID=A0A0P9F0X7_9BACL|nr:4a-hydroxytetrahydrobiopterin dehydratase [Alicyclobacillus ferrooxydans]KPV45000.1 pterin-4-alpha-carbinolamine dehydratase [Alicyclobacillus ferrooxydans]